MSKPYNYKNNIKDKENKILNYYKRINNIEQPKLFIVPKKKKVTKKNIARDNNQDNNKDSEKNESENHIKSDKDEKEQNKLTKKRIVIMD